MKESEERLQESEDVLRQALLNQERLRSLFENNPDGMSAVDTAGTITDINDAALALMGYERAEVVGRSFTEFFDEADLPPLLESFQRTLHGKPERVEARPLTKDGRHLELECTSSPIFSEGEVVGVYVALEDISARKHAQRALVRQHERIRELYLCATATDASIEDHIRRTVELGCRMLDTDLAAIYDAQSGAATTFRAEGRASIGNGMMIPLRLCRAAADALDEVAFNDPEPLAAEYRAGGETAIAAFIGVPVDVAGARFGSLCFAATAPRLNAFEPGDHDLAHLIAILVGTEIERRQAGLQLRFLAYYDALTGLPNRLLLKERLDSTLAAASESGHKSAVLFLDLDRFKDVNDTLGHGLADRLLQLTAERIVGCVRSSEAVARIGGDEFVVVMPAIRETSEALALAERLLRAIDAPFSLSGHEQHTTTSIGIAVAPGDGTDSEELIANADKAMYRAKERGRNTFVLFEGELDEEAAIER